MPSLIVIAVDPGETTGVCVLEYEDLAKRPKASLLQIEGNSVITVLGWLLDSLDFCNYDRQVGVIESYVTRRGSPASTSADFTRELIPRVEALFTEYFVKVHRQTAADVKPWATDKRLAKAMPDVRASIHGKSRDAFDAARHALYAATLKCFAKDPLA